MPVRIDLNADLGEGMGGPGADAAMLDVVSSANVACGGHAGDAASMRSVCAEAVARGVRIGAHVSYPDVAGFGRVEIGLDGAALLVQMRRQLEALTTAAAAVGGDVTYLKPHGALYHRVTRDVEHAAAVVSLAREAGLAVVGLPGSIVLDLADAAGLPAIGEAFADRGYAPDGHLVPRGTPGALLHEPDVVALRMVGLVRSGTVAANDGTPVRVAARTICVHSDTPGAITIAQAVRRELVAAGIEIAATA